LDAPTQIGLKSYNKGVKSFLNVDLHCHSVVSDGTLTPIALAQRAHKNGVELWALTDHDEVGGQAQAKASAKALGLSYLTGVEISVTFAHKTVHIVGLGFDDQDPLIQSGLLATRGGREKRAREMSDQLAKVGIPNCYEGALGFAGNPELISRTHFARHLVETGVCSDTNEVFRNYLTEGKPGFIEHRWASLKDAVHWITACKGMAIIAHPGRYGFTPTEEFAFMSEFKAHGGQGIEVVTGSHTPDEYIKYADVALEFDFAASRGSDFHSPNESRIDLGALPWLPGKLKPVWELLEHRIQ